LLAAVANSRGDAAAAINDLRALGEQADAEGRKYVSVAASVLLADALIKTSNFPSARQELERTLGTSEKLGLRLETARIHYFLGTTLRLSGEASDASAQYRQAGGLFEVLRKEQGSEHLLDRYDLKPVYGEIARFAQ
jgi:hypothetical protein